MLRIDVLVEFGNISQVVELYESDVFLEKVGKSNFADMTVSQIFPENVIPTIYMFKLCPLTVNSGF